MNAVGDFVEGFALRLSEAGMQRMAARVFTTILVSPEGAMTAREISDSLGVSAGAVSGATRYLTHTRLVERTRRAGERADRFTVDGTTWAAAIATETTTIEGLSHWLERGVAASPEPETRRRLNETREFFDFLARELPLLVDRWHAERGDRP